MVSGWGPGIVLADDNIPVNNQDFLVSKVCCCPHFLSDKWNVSEKKVPKIAWFWLTRREKSAFHAKLLPTSEWEQNSDIHG